MTAALDRAALRALEAKAWPAPWTAHTFEIDCPCPNGDDCGDPHSCAEVEAREAYPASPEEPAAEGCGQCVVQITVPGLESLAGPNAEFIAALRNQAAALLDALDAAERVIAGTAYPSDATLTREQAFHGWYIANLQRDKWSERAQAAEARAESARAEAIELRETLVVLGYHAPPKPGQRCQHGMEAWVGSHCKWDCAALATKPTKEGP